MNRPPNATDASKYIEPALLAVLEGHPLVDIAATLGLYLKVGCDCVTLILFLSRVAARLGWPINLAISSTSPGTDHTFANRILHISAPAVEYVSTRREMQKLARAAFPETEIVSVRNGPVDLFQFACETTSQDSALGLRTPGIWLIGTQSPASVTWGPTINLMVDPAERSMAGVGYLYSSPDSTAHFRAGSQLAKIMDSVQRHTIPTCIFSAKLRSSLLPEQTMVVVRLMHTLAVLRILSLRPAEQKCSEDDNKCATADYALARAILNALPIWVGDSPVSAQSLQAAHDLYDQTEGNPQYQQTVPDKSEFGRKLFTRRIAAALTGCAYTTVKKHLNELEGLGAVVSTIERKNRNRGLRIWFCFADNVRPPFTPTNPYASLPPVEDIA